MDLTDKMDIFLMEKTPTIKSVVGNIVRKGDTVSHPRFGIGTLIRVDGTYSVPMLIVKFRKHPKDEIARPETEFV